MSLISKLFRSPVKEWEREYVKKPAAPKAKPIAPLETPVSEPEVDEPDDKPGFAARMLGPSIKPWEQQYADDGAARKIQYESTEDALPPEMENAGKLQKALYAIAVENREVPDLFQKKAKHPAAASNLEAFLKPGSMRRSARHQRSASMPEIDGAITSALAAVAPTSPDQLDEMVVAVKARLQGKAVDPKILIEKVKAKLA